MALSAAHLRPRGPAGQQQPCQPSTSYHVQCPLLRAAGRRAAPPPCASPLSSAGAAASCSSLLADSLQPQQMRHLTPGTVTPLAGLKKERKRLTKVLKTHRKRLERMLPAVTVEAPEPVLADLLTELRALTQRLEQGASQRHIDALLHDDSDSDSESEDDCTVVVPPLRRATACALRRQPQPQQQMQQMPAVMGGDGAQQQQQPTMVLHQQGGRTLEVPVPDVGAQQPAGMGSSWDADAYAAMQFEGAGRVLVCQGGKCQRKGALEVLQAVSALASGSPGIEVLPCKCVGKCSEGAALRVRPEGQKCAVYTRVTPDQLPGMFEAHFAAPPQAPEADAPACCTDCKSPHSQAEQQLVQEQYMA